jgi:uncharacterized protein
MIVDFHTHVLSPRTREKRAQYIATDTVFSQFFSDNKAKIVTADELIDSMDRDGVDVSVVAGFAWGTSKLCLENNDYILESITRYPKRLTGFCTIQPGSTKEQIAEIERCARGGARGIGELRPDLLMPGFSDKEAMQPFGEVIKKHHLILLTHASEPVGHVYPGKGEATPSLLYRFITNFPELTVVCAHWGGGLPFYALMPEVKTALKNVYFDTAASPYLYDPKIYTQVSQIIGADKILFGSDFPLMPQSRVIQEINSTKLSPEEKMLILSGNACRLLGIKK